MGDGMTTTKNVFIAFAVGLMAATTLYPASITVNTATRYQTIEGFGGMGAIAPDWAGGTFWNQAFVNLVIDTIGVSIVRMEVPPTPDETMQFRADIQQYYKACKQRADEKGQIFKAIASVWSPPTRFKTNGNLKNGGNLKMSMVNEYADFLVAFLKQFKQTTGFDLYALSVQNEPTLAVYYNSCQYSASDMAATIVATAHKIKDAGLPTVIQFSDDVYCQQSYMSQELSIIKQDSVANRIARFCSVHYGGGGGNDACYKGYSTMANAAGKTAWNSEFGNGPHTWNMAYQNARAFWDMLRDGFSAIVYWYLSHNGSDEGVMINGKRGPKSNSLQMYARYIRPGAVRVECTSSDQSVWSVAFTHDLQKTVTVLLLNTSSNSTTATVSGTSLPAQFDVIQASANQNCVSIGSAAPGATVNLSPQSITVLYNKPIGGEIPGTSVLHPAIGSTPRAERLAVSSGNVTELYDVRGRSVLPGTVKGNGVYFSIIHDVHGTVLHRKLAVFHE
jgi:O-glycosyl hydrolase